MLDLIQELEVRIRLAPPKSLQTIGSSAAEPITVALASYVAADRSAVT